MESLKSVRITQPPYNEINFYGSKPRRLENFDWRGPLARANVLDWVITGFAVSRGQQYLHPPFLNWCDLNLNYDSAGVISDFSRALTRYDKLLSGQERKRLSDAFLKQPDHGKRIKDIKATQGGARIVFWQIADAVEFQLGKAVEGMRLDEDPDLPADLQPDALEGISKAEFLRRVNSEFRRDQEVFTP